MTSGQLPFLLMTLAFLLTFVTTRVITRLIRAGRGPFRNNVSGGVHIHHAVPGIILTLIGAYLSVAVNGSRPFSEISGVLIGVGSSLILDEFALILHLQDVYWSPQGQLSVQLVALALSGMGLVLLGMNPFSANAEPGAGPIAIAISTVIHITVLLICVRKGKYSTAVIGVFVPLVAWVGAIRLARPKSIWADRRYSGAKLEKAERRADGFDARFGRWGLSVADWVAGAPSLPNPERPPAVTAAVAPAPASAVAPGSAAAVAQGSASPVTAGPAAAATPDAAAVAQGSASAATPDAVAVAQGSASAATPDAVAVAQGSASAATPGAATAKGSAVVPEQAVASDRLVDQPQRPAR
ncbi:hypothetical protein [Actinoplanes sp. TBRC 11911]|uniref:hypothetical protein n=1 Tax=Actinoplanes sp. TBRC 11911 TaxID=2729386 RepID=UPI001B7D558A|nr:hypothetical protein [Actinoplanes sp. TBRC 11911]